MTSSISQVEFVSTMNRPSILYLSNASLLHHPPDVGHEYAHMKLCFSLDQKNGPSNACLNDINNELPNT
ncbi:hypothetical protein LguiA_010883 [Lonicera macranthoides]